ncbi:acetylxylan esterase [Deinococcus peraridilitoris]|uniref:Acetyl esterase (Deacetylase) n=1 Tax=Deinococcus peraridilitoris (strain DSM 19664 / LMG 22246 / CIP 109416 / KR-200) TaxID=937777 RepID=L0A3Q4_DEIPD|nr:acetylxylan esterase [Deinococcus peraridilitoris]AFZ67620.1 acetyl esterase (deacetylase) [Deinococcus peraridilitoris DSM 19664]
MAYFDLPEHELRTYRPPRHEPTDFDAFWARTLAESRERAQDPQFVPVEALLATLEVFDVTFSGALGSPVRGWLVLPRQRTGPLPCVVEFIGYGGGRGLPHEWLLYASAGYAHFVMDTRGQGSGWRQGDTPDEGSGGEPHLGGFMTLGLHDPHRYYYRRVYTDAARAVETARTHPAVDASRVAVTGGSQGGGLALAAAALMPDVQACLPDVPFLCHFERALRITDSFPYGEIAQYLRIHRDATQAAMHTLSYFDGLHFAARARARALFSVGLMDDICPPSTVYAAFNHYGGEKRMVEYPFNRHEGGQAHQDLKKIHFLREVFGAKVPS